MSNSNSKTQGGAFEASWNSRSLSSLQPSLITALTYKVSSISSLVPGTFLLSPSAVLHIDQRILSTGGIIALGMTARNWTVQRCAEVFEKFCRDAFVIRKGMGIPMVSRIIAAYNHSKYETKPLEEVSNLAFCTRRRSREDDDTDRLRH